MKYVVIDLEMCKVPKAFRCEEYGLSTETIQIGAVLLNERYEVVKKFNTYVRPSYGRLDSFIHRLTGIDKADIYTAPGFEEAFENFLDWIGEEDVSCVSWSDTDKFQLEYELAAKNINDKRVEPLLNKWIDCQKTFGDKMNATRAIGLEEALIASDISPTGRAHDGLMDAYNTAMLFAKLERDPDYKLNSWYESAKEETTEHLSISLGDMFKDLMLDLAV